MLPLTPHFDEEWLVWRGVLLGKEPRLPGHLEVDRAQHHRPVVLQGLRVARDRLTHSRRRVV